MHACLVVSCGIKNVGLRRTIPHSFRLQCISAEVGPPQEIPFPPQSMRRHFNRTVIKVGNASRAARAS